MRPALAKLGSTIVKLGASARSSSSASNSRQIRIEMPRNMSEEFHDNVSRYYASIDESSRLKPLTTREGDAAFAKLESMVRKDSELDSVFKGAREDDVSIAIVNGITLPEISKSEIPRSMSDPSEQTWIKKIRPAEITMYAYGRLLGVKPTSHMADRLITPIFATEADRNNPSSYRSSNELLWHNDGWGNGEAIPHILLLGVVGKKEIRTEIVNVEDVIKHFIDSGKKELLQPLGREQMIDDGEFTPITILDAEKRKINYAKYGYFMARGSDIRFCEALDFLNKTLDLVPSTKINFEKGQLASIDNRRNLHRKITEPSAATEPRSGPVNTIGERLLLRLFGERRDGR